MVWIVMLWWIFGGVMGWCNYGFLFVLRLCLSCKGWMMCGCFIMWVMV